MSLKFGPKRNKNTGILIEKVSNGYIIGLVPATSYGDTSTMLRIAKTEKELHDLLTKEFLKNVVTREESKQISDDEEDD